MTYLLNTHSDYALGVTGGGLSDQDTRRHESDPVIYQDHTTMLEEFKHS